MKKRKSFALVVMIAVISILTILSTALIVATTNSFKISTSYDSSNRVNMMAQSGIQLALNKIKSMSSLSYPFTLIDTKSEDETIHLTASITHIDYDPDHPETIKKVYVNSTAMKNSYTKTINVVISKNSFAIFVNNSLDAEQNGTIKGDIYVNGSDPIDLEHIIHTGTITYNADITYPSVVFPERLNTLLLYPDIIQESNGTDTISSSGGYSNITLANKGVLIVKTDGNDIDIKVGTLTLQNSSIVIEGTGVVTFYIDNLSIDTSGAASNIINGNYYLGSSTTLVNNLTVNGSIYSNAPNLTFGNSAVINGGIIYAPGTNITMGNSDYYASVIGNNVTLQNNILIDITDAANPEGASIMTPYTIESWN